MDKKSQRLRRARRAHFKIRELGAIRLCVHRTPRHIYTQVISPMAARFWRQLQPWTRTCVPKLVVTPMQLPR